MGELLTPTHLTVVAVIAFLVFGGRKLPEIGKGIGDGFRAFADGLKGPKQELADQTDATASSEPK